MVIAYPGGIQRHWLSASDGINKAEAQLKLKLEKGCEEQQEKLFCLFFKGLTAAKQRLQKLWAHWSTQQRTK